MVQSWNINVYNFYAKNSDGVNDVIVKTTTSRISLLLPESEVQQAELYTDNHNKLLMDNKRCCFDAIIIVIIMIYIIDATQSVLVAGI